MIRSLTGQWYHYLCPLHADDAMQVPGRVIEEVHIHRLHRGRDPGPLCLGVDVKDMGLR
jgi:hypothetical protein